MVVVLFVVADCMVVDNSKWSLVLCVIAVIKSIVRMVHPYL